MKLAYLKNGSNLLLKHELVNTADCENFGYDTRRLHHTKSKILPNEVELQRFCNSKKKFTSQHNKNL